MRGPARGRAFQRGAHHVDFLDVFEAQVGDDEPLPGDVREESFDRELPEGLPHRRPAHLEGLRQRPLVRHCPRGQQISDDRFAQGVIHGFAERLRFGVLEPLGRQFLQRVHVEHRRSR